MPASTDRRRLLALAAGACASPAWALQPPPHASFGPVSPPQDMPVIGVKGVDGKPRELRSFLTARATALQLMFTGCSATCPIQGALFADVQQRLGANDADVRLLSVSIDPLGDDVKALATWLQRFGAGPHWTAALPGVADVDRLLDFLRGRAAGADRHTAQVYVFDRDARLTYRTADMPPGESLVALLRHAATK